MIILVQRYIKIVYLISFFLCLGLYSYSQKNKKQTAVKITNVSIKLSGAVQFLSQNPSYNQDIVFLIDMKIPSGKNRFFIVDVKNKKVIDKGLVAHGYGEDGSVKFSNKPGSEMSSLGKYKIGESYNGKYGKSYKLYGLDSTNSNAFSRGVVIHEYDEMPYEETDAEIVRSQGCPMVNKQFFIRIEKILDTTSKPILLEIYYRL
jgi:hypothetical protein